VPGIAAVPPPAHLPRYKLRHTLKGHTHGVVTVKFSADGEMLASGSADKTVRVWQTSSGDQLRVLEGHTQVRCPTGTVKGSGAGTVYCLVSR
jgi:COMPASS component SWD3